MCKKRFESLHTKQKACHRGCLRTTDELQVLVALVSTCDGCQKSQNRCRETDQRGCVVACYQVSDCEMFSKSCPGEERAQGIELPAHLRAI